MKTKRLVRAALIAAIYVALCFATQSLAYGGIQFRFSEALTILPVFTPDAVWALTLGCLLANTISMSPWDMLLGTLATLIAALLTRRLRHVRTKSGLPWAACLPPIFVNMLIVGPEITYIFMPETASVPMLLFNMLTVGIGQAVCAGAMGLTLARAVNRTPVLKRWFED